jgi:ubiquinone/menaquinone biosynthesis C-methylase UbiE
VKDRSAAALYDHLGRLGERELAPRRRALLAHARGQVLELGAGTGFNVEHYPDAVEELVLTDPSAAMLSRATRRALQAGPPARAVQTPAERLPFDDGSFDTVVATLVLCSVDDQDRVLAEIRRVLRPEGLFLFIEHVRSADTRRARWQDRLERPWGVIACGCHPNRATLASIEAAGFELEALESDELEHALPIVRPLITGRAAAQRQPLR